MCYPFFLHVTNLDPLLFSHCFFSGDTLFLGQDSTAAWGSNSGPLSLSLLPFIDFSGVIGVNFFKKQMKRIQVRRNYNQVHMVWHKAVSEHWHLVATKLFTKNTKVQFVVSVLKEDYLSSSPSLGDVMGDIGKHYALSAWHTPLSDSTRESFRKE